MANSKKKWYYVLVFTNNGPKYLTGFGEHNMAYWDEEKKPLALTKSYAESVVYGLSLNLFQSVVATSLYELEQQPYAYDRFSINWVPKEDSAVEEE